MNQPTFDKHGYPTDETLETIARWPHNDLRGLVEFVKAAWSHDYGRVTEVDGRLELVTGGWSGNEAIVDALWLTTTTKMKRGGKRNPT